MYEQETSVFTIAPSYAYGEKGNPALKIPPYSTLEFEIELHSFKKGKETFEMSNQEKVNIFPHTHTYNTLTCSSRMEKRFLIFFF